MSRRPAPVISAPVPSSTVHSLRPTTTLPVTTTSTTAAAAAPALEDVPAALLPRIVNVVATVDLNCQLDLKEIALKCRNAEYNPKRFTAVIMRIRDPKTTALIFGSGKMVVTGAKTETDSKLAARKFARIVQKVGFEMRFTNFRLQNVVGSTDVGFAIRLEGLASEWEGSCSYEPELFPGLVFRMADPKVVLLIFVSGKVVLTGAKSQDDINQAFANIYHVLSQYKKT